MYFRTSGYEVVPEVVTPNEFAARTPLDRELEKGWRTGAKPQIEAKKVDGPILDADHARNFLDCVKSRKTPTCDVEYGHRCTTRGADRQHRAPDEVVPGVGREGRAVHQQRRGEQAAHLRVPQAVQVPGCETRAFVGAG